MSASPTLFDRLLADALRERERVGRGVHVVSREDCPPEHTPMGTLRWYLHHHLEGPSTRALYVHELEIPAGSRSGRLRCQGGIVHFVLEGTGLTEVDGTEHDWEPCDVIAVPIKEMGVTYQHFNTGSEIARLLVAWPNLDSAIGAEGGVAMEVLEPAPDHDGGRAKP